MRFDKNQFVLLIILALLLLIGSFGAAETYSVAQSNPLGTDLVVIIESSSSMAYGDNASDPNKYRYDAAASLINLCDAENSRANYLLFNEHLYIYANKKRVELTEKNGFSLFDISLSLGRTSRMQMLTDLTENNKLRSLNITGSADIGKALITAVNTMLLDQSDNQKIIVLLIDGGITFSTKDRTSRQLKRLEETSYQNVTEARTKAEENGITIHTVLLKDTSVADFAQSELCTKDGTLTIVSDPQQLPSVFIKILADKMGSSVMAANSYAKEEAEITIPVQNSSVKELNIVLPLNHLDASTMRLISPDGKEMNEFSDSFYQAISPYYAIFKVMSPMAGNWRICFKGDNSGNNITAQYVLMYDCVPTISLSSDCAGKNERIIINSAFLKNGITVQDSTLYQIPATLALSKNGTIIQSFQMTSGENGYTYTLEPFINIGAGEYTISIHYEGNGMVRDTANAFLTISNMEPKLRDGSNGSEFHNFTINTPGVEESYAVQSCSWDLSQMVYDPDGDELKWTIASSPSGIIASIAGSTLNVSTIKNTTEEGDILVAVTDSDGKIGPTLKFHIVVVATSDSVDTIVYGPTVAITKTNDTATIKVQYSINGTTLTVGDYYNIPATLTLKKENQILRSGLPMTYNGSAYEYTLTDLSQYGSGTFEVDVRLQSGSFVLDCTPYLFSLENLAPIIVEDMPTSIECSFEINNPNHEETYQAQSQTYDLKDYAFDPDGDSIEWAIEKNTAEVKASIVGTSLTITTKKNVETTGDIIVKISDSDGAVGPSLTFHVEVSSAENKLDIFVSGPAKAIDKNETVEIQARLIQNGVVIAKDSELNTIPATLALTKGQETIVSALSMSCSDGIYTVTLPSLSKYGSGEYSVAVTFNSGSFYKTSEVYSFTLTNSAPVLVDGVTNTLSHEFKINDPTNNDSYQPQTWSYDLSQLVNDVNKETITYAVVQISADVKAVINGSTLTVTTFKDKGTSGDITISVSDTEGAMGPELTVHVDVVSIEDELSISITVPTRAMDKSNSITITAHFIRNGSSVDAGDALNTLPVTLALYKGEEKLESNLLMTFADGNYQYTFDSLAKYGSGMYRVIAQVSAENCKLLSAELTFELTNQMPKLVKANIDSANHRFDINIPGNSESYQPLNWNIDLSELVKDPNGDELTWIISGNTADVETSIEQNELIVTTIQNQPTVGEITVIPKDDEGMEGPVIIISIEVVSIEEVYDQYTAKFQPITQANKNTDIDLVLWIYDQNGIHVTDDSYLPLDVIATISSNHEGEKINLPLVCNEEDNYSGIFHTDDLSADYQINAAVTVGNKSISAEVLHFNTVNRSPVAVEDLAKHISKTLLLGIESNQDIDLKDVFEDPDGDPLTYAIIENTLTNYAQISVEGSTLQLRPQSANFCFPVTGHFMVTVTDTENAVAVSSVITVTIWPVLWITLITFILIAVIVALIKFNAWKNARFGSVAFDVSYGYMGLELSDGLSDPLPKGGHSAISLDAYYTEQARFVAGNTILPSELKKIAVKPLAKDAVQISIADGMNIPVALDQPKYADGDSYAAQKAAPKTITLKPNESFSMFSGKYSITFKLVHIIKKL